MSEQRTLDNVAGETSLQSDEIRSSLDETSVGTVPNSWKKVRLSDIVHKSEYGAAESSEDFDSEKPRYVRITDINSLGQLKPETKVSLSEEKANGYLLDEDDLLFARSGASVGKTYLYRQEDSNCAYAGYLIRHEVNRELANSEFLYQYTDSPNYNYWVERIQRTGAQPNINAREYGNLLIPYPPLEEQRKIATALYTVDQAIQKTEEIIEQAEVVQNGLMQKLFRRGIGDLKTKDLQRIGRVPEHWEVVKLGEVCDRVTDGTHKSPPTTEEGYPYITSQNVRNWGFELDNLKYISKEDHERITSRCNPEAGDVLYVKDGANTGNVNVNTLDFDFSLLSSVALIKPDRNRVTPWFLKYLLSWPKFRELVLSQMSGTGIRRLTISKLEKTDVLVPPLEEQEQIVDILNNHYLYRENQQEYRTELKRFKQGLMQDLLSGTVRTDDVDIAVLDDVLAHG